MRISDWSSDVCSSDLAACVAQVGADRAVGGVELGVDHAALTAEPGPIFAIFAVALDREHGVDAVRLAQVEVIFALIGRHMDKAGDRKSVVSGKSVSVRVDLGGRRNHTKKKQAS